MTDIAGPTDRGKWQDLLENRKLILLWAAILLGSALVMTNRDAVPWLYQYPDQWVMPVSDFFAAIISWFESNLKWLFRAVSGVLEWPMWAFNETLRSLPWLTIVGMLVLIAWQGGGARLAVLVLACLFYILGVGYWLESMSTFALVLVSVPLSIVIGFGVGIWATRNQRVDQMIGPVLDLMQTVPAFAYLIPILILFGFGPVVGLIASVIFSVPPMVRNTILGLKQVDASISESSEMNGCTARQKFWWAVFPSALPQIMVGINQATMAALSMVIIAAIIGGFGDIGWEVLSRMRKAQAGQSALSGLVIVALAIMLDRMTIAYARRQLPVSSQKGMPARRFVQSLVGIALATLALAWVFPALWQWPKPWEIYPADQINAAVEYILAAYGPFLKAVKNGVLFFVLLPVKLGLSRAIAPFTWGFSPSVAMITGYWVVAAICVAGAFFAGHWRKSVGLALFSGVLFFGVTGLAWSVVVVVVSLLAYLLGGWRVGLTVLGSLVFLLVCGLWGPAMISIYLCSVAVMACILLGGGLGILASESASVSAAMRVINDTLQTMPQFALLIPALMLFQVGEFTALLAIIAYAIVPMIRYTEQGLRAVPGTLIEAGLLSGCNRWQIFWLIKIPTALPQILLGINQTTLFALGMLVIAAMVGTTGLGQQIFIALGKADAGLGITAGLGMALIAISVDRMLKAAATRLST